MTATQLELIAAAPQISPSQNVALDELPPDAALLGEPSQELLRSVAKLGVLTPIHVDAETLAVLDGRRRIKAARAAGLTHIPYQSVRQTPGSVEAAVVGVATHATRRRNPVTEYETVRDLVAKGFTEQGVAEATGFTHQQIKSLLRYRNILPEVWDLVRAGVIAPGVAFEVAKLTPPAQLQLLEHHAAGTKLTGKLVRELRSVQVRQELDVLKLPGLGAEDTGGAVPPRQAQQDWRARHQSLRLAVEQVAQECHEIAAGLVANGEENRAGAYEVVIEMLEAALRHDEQ